MRLGLVLAAAIAAFLTFIVVSQGGAVSGALGCESAQRDCQGAQNRGEAAGSLLGPKISQNAPTRVAQAGWETKQEPVKICWSPDQLRGVPGDWKVKKEVSAAFQSAPNRKLLPFDPLPEAWRGVIRRVHIPDGRKVIALTFDVCEQPYEVSGYDSRVVDYLRDEKVKATFFISGKWFLTHKLRAEQILSDPLFEAGNHTWEHRNLRIVSNPVLHEEIEYAQASYEQVREEFGKLSCKNSGGTEQETAEGKTPPARMTLFRFPFGACHAASLKAVNDAGLLAIQWDISSGDPWPLQTPDRITKTVLPRVRPGSILLFHANGRGWHTSEALREVIPRLRAQGYEFLTVSELLHYPGAQIEKAETCYDQRPGDSERYDDLARRLEAKFAEFTKRMIAAKHSGTATATSGGQ
jgi:peptidoglycan/xylan/chitin deacetylase (PgdA/CDA1 family)